LPAQYYDTGVKLAKQKDFRTNQWRIQVIRKLYYKTEA